LFPYAWYSASNAMKVIKYYCKTVFFVLRIFLNIRLDIRGVIPKNIPAIICSKHQSFLDVLILLYVLPEPRFIMKSELTKIPIFSFYAKKIGCFSVERNNKRSALSSLIETIKKEQNEASGQLIIYPEGTRTEPGKQVRYKKGIQILFSKLKRPLFLVSTNSGLIWPYKDHFKPNGVVTINFIGKINYVPKDSGLVEKIQKIIEKDSLELYLEEKSRI
jgi:1-acyl-sn-glycerol-3-phosphate acyltransferase